MTPITDEKGKVFTAVIPKEAVLAMIQTTTHLVSGKIHVQRNIRIKDELDLDEPFLAVTDATISANDGRKLFRTSFLAVQRSQIVWVLADMEKEQFE